MSFGAMLVHARTQRGLSHDDVARHTRIAKRYVLALENESISSLPGGLYSRAYVRTYAAFLGLDADSVVRDYDRAVLEHGDDRLAAQPDQIDALRAVIKRKESQTPGKHLAMARAKSPVGVSMAVVVLAGGVWVGARHISYPVGVVASQVSTSPAAASDTVAKSGVTSGAAVGVVLTERELRSSDSEKQPHPISAAPVPTSARKTAEVGFSEARDAPTSLSVGDSGVGTDVVDRELVGRSETFVVGTRIVFWTLVNGGRAGDTIRHAWFHSGRPVATVKLSVAGANWRTHSQRMLGPNAEGEWVVEARDEHGRVLARHAFRCGP